MQHMGGLALRVWGFDSLMLLSPASQHQCRQIHGYSTLEAPYSTSRLWPQVWYALFCQWTVALFYDLTDCSCHCWSSPRSPQQWNRGDFGSKAHWLPLVREQYIWGTVKQRNAVKSPCSYFPVYKCDNVSMENIPSRSFCLPFFFFSCSSNPFVIDHFAQYTWPPALILKPTGLAWSLTNRVTLARGWKGREVQSASSSSSRDLSRDDEQWESDQCGFIARRAQTPSQKRVIKSDMYFGKGHWLLCSDLWRNMSGPLLKINWWIQDLGSYGRLDSFRRWMGKWSQWTPQGYLTVT